MIKQIQPEPVFLKLQQTLVAHFAQFAGHGASVHRQEVGKLLTIEGNRNVRTVLFPGFPGKIGNQLFSCGPPRHMIQLLQKAAVFFGDGEEQVLHHHGMKSAGGRAGGDDALHIKEEHDAVFNGNHVVEQRAAVRVSIGLPEDLSDGDLPENAAIAPKIIFLNTSFWVTRL